MPMEFALAEKRSMPKCTTRVKQTMHRCAEPGTPISNAGPNGTALKSSSLLSLSLLHKSCHEEIQIKIILQCDALMSSSPICLVSIREVNPIIVLYPTYSSTNRREFQKFEIASGREKKFKA
jgi:hypothetical protein